MTNHTIMIIEDNEDNRLIVRDLLQVNGYQTLEASDGGIGLEMVRRHKPGLILTDVQLPTVDGYTITRTLKAEEATRHIPIIAITSFAMPHERQQAHEAGCDGYISKPIDIHALLDMVQRLLPQ